MPISAYDNSGINELLETISNTLEDLPKEDIYKDSEFEDYVLYELKETKPYSITKDGDIWVVKSKELEKFEDMLKAISEKYKDKYKANFYEIYKLKFYDDKSLDKIVEASNLNSRRAVINALDMIAGMFYSYMNLNNLDEELTIVS